MADFNQEILLTVKTDASQASQDVNQLKGELQDVNNSTIDKPFKSLKSQIKEATVEAQKMATQFGVNSEQFRKAAKEVEELKGQFDETNIAIKAFNPDNKLQSLTTIAGGSVKAIQGVTGGIQFLGIESGKAQEQIARLQGLMAFSDALNSIGDIKDAFKGFGNVIAETTLFQKANNAATTVAAVATKGFGIAAETSSTGFKVLKGAIVATGIGALVIGLVMLVQNFDSVKKAVLNLIPGLSGIASFIGKIINAVTDFVGITSEAERATEKLVASTEKEIKRMETFLDSQGYKYDEFTQRKIKANLEYNKHLVEINKDETLKEEQKQALLKQYRDKANFEIDEADKARAEKVKKQLDEELKKQKEHQDKLNEERYQRELAAQAKLKAISEKGLKAILDAEAEVRKGYSLEKQLDELKKQKDADLQAAAAIGYGGKIIIDAYQKRRAEIEAEIQKRDAESASKAEEERLKKQEQTLKNIQSQELVVTQTLINNNEERQRSEEELRNVRIEGYKNIGIAANALGDIIGKQTVASKALGVATALINTYQGVTEALKQKSTLPSPFDVIAKVANVATILATGISAVKNITKVQVPNSSGGGAVPSVDVASPTAPQINAQAATQQQIQDVRVTNPNQAPIKAYITNSDLQTNQQRTNFLNSISTI